MHDYLQNPAWYRFTAEFQVMRRGKNASEPAVAIIQSAIKGALDTVGGGDRKHTAFHITKEPLNFNCEKGRRFKVELMLNRPDNNKAAEWRKQFIRWFTSPPGSLNRVFFEHNILPFLSSDQKNIMLFSYKGGDSRVYLKQGLSAGEENVIMDILFSSGYFPRNLKLLKSGELESRTLEKVLNENPVPAKGNDEVCLELHTPARFNDHRRQTFHSMKFEDLLKELTGAVTGFFGKNVSVPGSPETGNFTLLPWYMHYQEARRHKGKGPQGLGYLINGYCGRFYIRGEIHRLYPLLPLCAEINMGGMRTFGMGHFTLHKTRVPFFDGLITNESPYRKQMEHLLKSPGKSGKEITEEDITGQVKRIVSAVSRGNFPVGITSMPDAMIIHKTIYRVFFKHFDKMIPPDSPGYRKGVPASQIEGIISQAQGSGFKFGVHVRLEDFYYSVAEEDVKAFLEQNLPRGDVILMQFLLKQTVAFRQNDRETLVHLWSRIPRLLVNIHLHMRGSQLNSCRDLRLLRSDDDMVFLTRTRAQAESIIANGEPITGFKYDAFNDRNSPLKVNLIEEISIPSVSSETGRHFQQDRETRPCTPLNLNELKSVHEKVSVSSNY